MNDGKRKRGSSAYSEAFEVTSTRRALLSPPLLLSLEHCCPIERQCKSTFNLHSSGSHILKIFFSKESNSC